MELVRWNPRNNFWGLRGHINNVFDGLLSPALNELAEAKSWAGVPSVDIYDNDDTIVIKAEMPGLEKEDIAIDVKDGVLTLTGERKADTEVDENNYYRRERVYGSFKRRFNLPAEVNLEMIKADYTNGVLKIDIPKPEKVKPRKITIH